MPTLEEKKQALEVLIRQSILLDEAKKPELVYKIPQMSEEDINNLGQFLALEVKNAEQFYEENLPKLEKFIADLDATDVNK
ncbi:MAG: hypothetical protein ACOZAK_04035 [Patescibacteria group bacterium]